MVVTVIAPILSEIWKINGTSSAFPSIWAELWLKQKNPHVRVRAKEIILSKTDNYY